MYVTICIVSTYYTFLSKLKSYVQADGVAGKNLYISITCICYINLRYIYKGLVDIAVVVKIRSPYSSLGQIYT